MASNEVILRPSVKEMDYIDGLSLHNLQKACAWIPRRPIPPYKVFILGHKSEGNGTLFLCTKEANVAFSFDRNKIWPFSGQIHGRALQY